MKDDCFLGKVYSDYCLTVRVKAECLSKYLKS